jgi:hypothetical protein
MTSRRKIVMILFLCSFISLAACRLSNNVVNTIEYWGETVAPSLFRSEESECVDHGGLWIVINDETGEGECKWDNVEAFPDYPGGNVPENEADTSPAQDEASPHEVDTSVPYGTYVGDTTLPDYWTDTLIWHGTIEANEITIIVSEKGKVSGGMIVIGKGEKSTPIDGCVSQVNFYTEAEISGQLTETGGLINFDITRATEVWRSGCPADTETIPSSGIVQAQVSILGNIFIEGTVPDYFSFETTKQ